MVEFVSILPEGWVWKACTDEDDSTSIVGKTDPDDFGRVYWNTIGGLCASLPPGLRARWFTHFMHVIQCTLPCTGCREHFAIYMSAHPPAAVDWSDMHAAMAWLYRLRVAIRDRNLKERDITPAKACLKGYGVETAKSWTQCIARRLAFTELWHHDVVSCLVYAIRVTPFSQPSATRMLRELCHIILFFCTQINRPFENVVSPSDADVSSAERAYAWINGIPLARKASIVWAILRVSPYSPGT